MKRPFIKTASLLAILTGINFFVYYFAHQKTTHVSNLNVLCRPLEHYKTTTESNPKIMDKLFVPKKTNVPHLDIVQKTTNVPHQNIFEKPLRKKETDTFKKYTMKVNIGKTPYLNTTMGTTLATTTMDPNDIKDKEKIIEVARRIIKSDKTLLVSLINDAFLPLAYSWLCNTEGMGIHDQILIIATDEETRETLKRKRPEIATVSISGYSMKGNQTYTHAGYVRLCNKRTQILNWIIQENIGIFLFEFDCLWVRNPVPIMTGYVSYDLVSPPVAQRPGQFATGFYYMAPTHEMKKFWQELTRRLTVLDNKLKKLAPGTVISEGENDQLYFAALLRQRYAGIRIKALPLSSYPDGKWYSLPQHKRDLSNVFVLNNNWIIGNTKKIQRAKKYGHWFLKDDGTCNVEQVKKIVRPQ